MIVIVIIVPGYHNSYHLNVSLFYIDKIPLPTSKESYLKYENV